MAILRPLVELAAETYRNSVQLILDGIVETVSDDIRSWTWVPDPVEMKDPVFVPAREGKSLLSPVKSRTIYKRRYLPRWSEE